jgi:DNA-binding MarR family transcriptional regulator
MIDQVRRFNRTVTQRIGALDDAFLARDRPLGQARLLWEIGPDGSDVRRLRARLDLDSGYLSRLLRSLESDELVRIEPSEADGRVRTARLTGPGRAEQAELDRLSDDAAAALLEPLSPRQRDRLTTAMAEVERLLLASAIQIGVCDPRHPDARRAVQAYVTELSSRFEDGFDPARGISATDDEVSPPAGLFLLATLYAEPVGCGVLKFHPDASAHLKRMWVAREVRTGGPGRGPRRPRAPAGNPPRPERGDRPVPDGRLPRGPGVQRRALRPPLVREDDRALTRATARPPRGPRPRAGSGTWPTRPGRPARGCRCPGAARSRRR